MLLNPANGLSKLRLGRAEGQATAFDAHAMILRDAGETLIAGNEVELLIDGPATFDAMLADIAQAREHIFLQTYTFEGEDVGRRIADALLERAAQGVEVRLLYDAVGSLLTPASFFRELVEGGVRVCESNPITPWRRATGIFSLNHRDHRKLLVIDEKVAFTGGINVSAVYSSGSRGFTSSASKQKDTGWRDTHIRVRGPAVTEFTCLFQESWARQRGAGEVKAPQNPPPPPVGDRLVTVIGCVPNEDSGRFYRALLGAMNGANATIHITVAYFVPDPQAVELLAAAARRGVEVILVLPGFTDSHLAFHAGHSHYCALLEAGVRIFEFHDCLLHAKTVVIDGVWSTVGSSNFDWRSFFHNDELNAIILGREFASQMERQFAEDLERAHEVTLEEWQKRSLGCRVMERFGRLWEYWL